MSAQVPDLRWEFWGRWTLATVIGMVGGYAIQRLLAAHRGIDGEHIHLRSDAVLRIVAAIDGPWRRLAWLRVLPRPILDWGYRLFARNRYRMFGQLDVCPTPGEDERARFVP